ncbi:NADPH-dependent F420 reductase [Actinoalloteichus fjordicus]|uniref:Dinucleotide-binding enzyme n=1 Tax=Actinoalloteichus fjordicus TaxID=1612552 RepID=A0AAC9PTJ8_9PSEU|nr:NAD(P)-binding domain-containing protein [Actinoalloteichus fjordicus]APU16117.1 putative dinucleotide-binding enzyme [Actinoalloteichus fjordicus]
MTDIGFIGAGHIGGGLARRAVATGYDVVISNSRGPETLRDLVAELGEQATAGTTAEAAEAPIVVVSIPLKAYVAVPPAAVAGRIVIETNNYYPQRDGRIAELEARELTSSELHARHWPAARVVKAFNAIPAAEIATDASPTGTPNRRAIPIAGDDAAAKAEVTELIDRLGFDVVDVGTLAESWRIEPGTPSYGVRENAAQAEASIAAARRL